MGDLVFVGTGVAERAVAFAERFAIRPAAIEAKAVFALQEVGKGKGVEERGG